VLPIEAHSRFIDEGGGERVCVAESRALGADVFVALVESAAVGEARERTGLQPRLVEIAIAGEDLVSLAEVMVNPDVKLVDVVFGHRARGEIVPDPVGSG